MNTMDSKLREFLDKHRLKAGEIFSHTSKSGEDQEGNHIPSGIYYIGKDDMESFWVLYCNAVNHRCALTLSERSSEFAPLRVDFDIRSDLDVGTQRQYSLETLKKIVGYYQAEIKKIVHPDAFEPKLLWCIVLEKQAPRSENQVIKDGFHLHFPHFVCSKWVQDHHLRNRVTNSMIHDKIWSNAKISVSVDELIDKDMASKVWMLYGSMNIKNRHSTPYLYNRWSSVPEESRYGHAFDENLKEIEMKTVFEEEMIGRKNSVRYYLPRFLSIRGFPSPTPITEEFSKTSAIMQEKGRKRVKPIQKKRSSEEALADLKVIEQGGIMEMLSPDRADDYGSWMDIGWTLFNIGQGDDKALEMWKEFSRRSIKFVEGECERLWKDMEVRNKTIASLLAMAKADSPDEYREWKNTQVQHALDQSLYEPKPTEYDVAQVVCAMFKDRFVCADSKKDIWYEFRDHRWREMDDGIALKNLLVTDVMNQYYDFRARLAECAARADPGSSDRDHIDQKIKKCMAIITHLKKCAFHDKVIRMCKLTMHDENFLKKIDENRLILGCENGVIDLQYGKPIFRDGQPDDYITFSTGLEFQKYSKDDDEMREIDDYLTKVFPNPKLRNYFVDFMCSCMKGGNVHKRFLVNTGSGDNAKSITILLLKLVFGDYFGKFPRELIVRGNGNSSGSARPELAQVRGKRIMSFDEIAKNEEINIGLLKMLTGNDSYFVRSLYEKGSDITPQFTLIMQCNEPPKVPCHDEATWTRIRVLDFEAKFVKPQDRDRYEVPETFEEQMKEKMFHADPSFGERLPELAPALMWKLFENYGERYAKNGLEEPQEVLVATQSYKADNDIYLQFIRERIEKVEEEEIKENTIAIATMYSEFKDWYMENHPSYSKDKISKMTMRNELNKRLGVIKSKKDVYGYGAGNKWYGYRFIQEDGEEIEGFQHLLSK